MAAMLKLRRCSLLCGHTHYHGVGNYHRPHPPQGSMERYERGNPVRFRNLWIRPLSEYDLP